MCHKKSTEKLYMKYLVSTFHSFLTSSDAFFKEEEILNTHFEKWTDTLAGLTKGSDGLNAAHIL
jgi:SMC interacting uncharacterized protein involved in chromosome segregation